MKLDHLHSQSPTRRKRGVLLTTIGFQKLHDASVIYDALGCRRTFESLSDRTLLDPRTVSRIIAGVEKVDKRTLQQFFQAFDLVLESADYTHTKLPVALDSAKNNSTESIDQSNCIYVFLIVSPEGDIVHSSPTLNPSNFLHQLSSRKPIKAVELSQQINEIAIAPET